MMASSQWNNDTKLTQSTTNYNRRNDKKEFFTERYRIYSTTASCNICGIVWCKK